MSSNGACYFRTELARVREMPRLSSDESSIVHLLNEQVRQ